MLIAFGFGIISSINTVQAHEADWTWTVDPTCITPTGFKCNIPDGAINAGARIPDLREAVPQQLGLQNAHQTTTLRISTSVANTGNGQWQMRAVNPATIDQPQLANQQILRADGTLWNEFTVSQFEYHPEHHHFHIAAVTAYQLFTADGSSDIDPSNNAPYPGVGAEKVTFCLIDWVKISDNSPNNERAYSDCNGQFQGVSPGWMDQYHQELEGQEMDVTNVPTGYYFIVVTANPGHHFIETNFDNNQAWILIFYNNDNKGNPKMQIINQSSCSDYPGLCQYSPNR